jgi:uncharacterized membrane protein
MARVWRQAREALLLIAAATAVLVGLVAAEFIMDERLGLSGAWRLFVGGAAVYTVVAFYLLNRVRPLRDRFQVTKMLVATMVMEAPVAALWFLFYRSILVLPDSMLPYTIGGILLAPAMAMLIESFVLSGAAPWSRLRQGSAGSLARADEHHGGPLRDGRAAMCCRARSRCLGR